MTTCIVNGKKYEIPDGASYAIIGNDVYVNGKIFVNSKDIKEKKIEIRIDGNVGSLDSGSANVTINGNCETVSNGSGNLNIKGDVKGNVTGGSGNINCGNVGGNVKAGSGTIRCGNVSGSVTSNVGTVSTNCTNITTNFGSIISNIFG